MPSIEEPPPNRDGGNAPRSAGWMRPLGSPFGRPITLTPLGDEALMIDLADHVDDDVSALVLAITDRLGRSTQSGIVEVQPALASILVVYDPAQSSVADIATMAANATTACRSVAYRAGSAQDVAIPVCFDATFGLDLHEVAERSGLTPQDVIDEITAATYLVHAIGFLPGFAYMGPLSADLRLPRRSSPRVRVPAGSVAIAGSMAAVYPCDSPGGWHIVGGTPLGMFDVCQRPPSRLWPGDRVRFEAIDHWEHRRLCDERVARSAVER